MRTAKQTTLDRIKGFYIRNRRHIQFAAFFYFSLFGFAAIAAVSATS